LRATKSEVGAILCAKWLRKDLALKTS